SSIEMAFDLFAAYERAALGERRLQRAQTLALLGSYERDMRTGETFWSVQVLELLGDPQSEPSREWILEAVHPDDLPVIAEAVRAARLSGDRFDLEYRIITPEGEERWIHDRAEYWRDSSGEPVRAFGVLQDITERKRAELSLQSRDEERALLVREIHHRVKNNMETIESLLSLQSSVATEQATRDALGEDAPAGLPQRDRHRRDPD
ncbi:MAG: PAS domain-containing protein, partial [Spirochaetota bacterium]